VSTLRCFGNDGVGYVHRNGTVFVLAFVPVFRHWIRATVRRHKERFQADGGFYSIWCVKLLINGQNKAFKIYYHILLLFLQNSQFTSFIYIIFG